MGLCPHNRGFHFITVCRECGPESFCDICHKRAKRSRSEPPDYCHDLNSSAELERKLNTDERNAYAIQLEKLVTFGANPHWTRNFHIATATACQRCEAFLRVRGKWRPEWDGDAPTAP